MDALKQLCLDETFNQFQEVDADLYHLLIGNLQEYSTKNGKRLVVSRISRALNISCTTVNKRIEALRKILGKEDR